MKELFDTKQTRRTTIEPLQSILAAREQRAILKRAIAERGLPCLSLSLNVPGFPKSNPTLQLFFKHVCTDLEYFLKANLIDHRENESIFMVDDAGDHYLSPCSGNGKSMEEIKQLLEDFEENHSLGRFIDVDVNDSMGNTISSGKSKSCFFCGERAAIECRRLGSHDEERVRSFMFTKMAEFCRQQRENMLVKRISSLALKALLDEISLSPKPGLVDKFSRGSHADMDYQTFLASSAAIAGWFEALLQAGFSFDKDDLTKALPVIRNIGLRMETDMYRSTKNVNTHKGLIFLMGLSLFACGKLYSRQEQFDPEVFRGIIRDICKDIVLKELVPMRGSKTTHGEGIYRKYGYCGARGEAEKGFPMVFEFGLPQLTVVEKPGEEEHFKSLLAIAAKNHDTNILYRSGPVVSKSFRNLCKKALEDLNVANLSEVAEFCKSENISPGGSADLLAVTIFVDSVMRADQSKEFTSLSEINDF